MWKRTILGNNFSIIMFMQRLINLYIAYSKFIVIGIRVEALAILLCETKIKRRIARRNVSGNTAHTYMCQYET